MDTKVADRRLILENPRTPGQGVVVAAGDEIPAALGGYIENTPNKVDAALNYDTADAADQAKNARPADRVVSAFGPAADELREVAERTRANRAEYDERVRNDLDPQGWLPEEDFHRGTGSRTPTDAEERQQRPEAERGADDTTGQPLEELTGKQLDTLADSLGDGVEGYSKRASKADKVEALKGKVTQAQINAAAGE